MYKGKSKSKGKFIFRPQPYWKSTIGSVTIGDIDTDITLYISTIIYGKEDIYLQSQYCFTILYSRL